MYTFFRLISAEMLKLKRSAALRLLWLLPIFFLVLEFFFFERPAIAIRSMTSQLSEAYEFQHIKMVGMLWAGFFHPLLIAMIPALLFRPEHRFKLWRHIHTMPTSRRGVYAAKALVAMLLCTGSLGIIALGFWLERILIAWVNPALVFPFHGMEMVKVLGWLLLGSLPLLAIYLWLSDRINSLAVPVVFGLIGLLLTISLSGSEVPQPWKRDLIPWVLPYFCAQAALENHTPRQTAHIAGKWFQEEPNVLRLPDGRKVKTWQNVPDEVLFPPPPPTSAWVLATFSLAIGICLLGLGWLDSSRCRQ